MHNRETILLVGHGSRHQPGNREILKFCDQWRERHPAWSIEVCFIELASPLLDAGLDAAAAHAGTVIVVPLILNAAGHVKVEIPEYLEQARQRHPRTTFVYASHLGVNDTVLQILQRNLQQRMQQLDMPDPKTTGVILLGRGSSDRAANGELAKMTRWLFEESEHDLVELAFTGVTHPRVESVVRRQISLGMSQIIVLPYYLFTGTLMERIKRQLNHLTVQYPHVRFSLAGYFGFEEEVFALLDERVSEVRGEGGERQPLVCDGCSFRQAAHHTHHHHGSQI
ncbi:MAG: sirohydrochlorin chelatase [Chromatiales bacterium]|nr:sirohydrochlorin chelatase [Chromatiales bacterium]